jgi:hypothetical protein
VKVVHQGRDGAKLEFGVLGRTLLEESPVTDERIVASNGSGTGEGGGSEGEEGEGSEGETGEEHLREEGGLVGAEEEEKKEEANLDERNKRRRGCEVRAV